MVVVRAHSIANGAERQGETPVSSGINEKTDGFKSGV